MEYYKNISEKSGVLAYEYTQNGILVQFRNGGIYEYTTYSAGNETISKMKTLTRKGIELNNYINRKAKYLYSRRIK